MIRIIIISFDIYKYATAVIILLRKIEGNFDYNCILHIQINRINWKNQEKSRFYREK